MKVKISEKNSSVMLCRTAMLSAVALVLSIFESSLPPFPFVLPGMKLGLSNLAVMLSLEICPLPCALGIVVIKGLFALLSRGVSAFFMSTVGGLLATFGMYLLVRHKKIKFGCFGIGIFGAFVHNCGQLLVARILVSDAVFVYFPVLSLASLVTGSLTGIVYYIIIPYLRKIPLIGSQRFA